MSSLEKLEEKKVETKYDDVTYIEGIGTARETGNLDLEGLIRDLLKSKYITG